jgi:hypothetical protein
MMIGVIMPKQNCYVVRIIDKHMTKEYGLYYDGSISWVPINRARNYTYEYVMNGLSLTVGVHEILRIEPDGSLVRIQ